MLNLRVGRERGMPRVMLYFDPQISSIKFDFLVVTAGRHCLSMKSASL